MSSLKKNSLMAQLKKWMCERELPSDGYRLDEYSKLDFRVLESADSRLNKIRLVIKWIKYATNIVQKWTDLNFTVLKLETTSIIVDFLD